MTNANRKLVMTFGDFSHENVGISVSIYIKVTSDYVQCNVKIVNLGHFPATRMYAFSLFLSRATMTQLHHRKTRRKSTNEWKSTNRLVLNN